MPLAKVPALNSHPGHRDPRRSGVWGVRGGRDGVAERDPGGWMLRGPGKGCELGAVKACTAEQGGLPKMQAEREHCSGLSPGVAGGCPRWLR